MPLRSNACTSLDVGSLLGSAKVTGRKHVELIFLLVHGAVEEEESDTSDEGDDGDGTIVPDEMGVVGERGEGLSESSGEGGGEELNGLDERTHVLGCLGESILEGCDGGKDFGCGDEDVDTSDSPDVDGGLVIGVGWVLVEARGFVTVIISMKSWFTEKENVHVVLENGSPDHGEGAENETSSDLLDGSETNATLAKSWVDERVHDGHNDDNGNGIQVGENVIGNTVKSHGGAHLRQVGVHLTVSQPEDGDPEEHTAGGKTTTDLIDPGIVKVVPRRLVGTESGRLDSVPHASIVPVLVSADRVEAESTTKSLEQQLEGRAHDVTRRGLENVELLAEPQNRQADDEHDSGDQISQVETDITLSVDHAKLASESTNVDEEVEVVVDAGDGDSRVNNDTLAVLLLNAHALFRDLLGNQGRNVGLERSRTKTHDENTDNECTQSAIRLVKNRGNRRDRENDVTDFSDNNRVDNGLEATEISISNPSTEKRTAVDPEGIEGGQGEGDLLAHAQSTRLSIVAAGVEGGTGWGFARLGDEVGVDRNGSIVGHALDQFDKGNGVDSPGNGSRNAPQGAELLVSGEVFAILADVAILQGRLAFRMQIGGRVGVVEGGVLALRVARTVDEGRVKASRLLWGGVSKGGG